MNILFDTNVVLDVLLDRKPFSGPAANLFAQVEAGDITGLLGATTLTTVFYLATKAVGKKRAQAAVAELLTLFMVAPVSRMVLESALASPFPDFEDAVLYQAGLHAGAQGIVTRDVSGFKHSSMTVYTPDELMKMILALKK